MQQFDFVWAYTHISLDFMAYFALPYGSPERENLSMAAEEIFSSLKTLAGKKTSNFTKSIIAAL